MPLAAIPENSGRPSLPLPAGRQALNFVFSSTRNPVPGSPSINGRRIGAGVPFQSPF